MNKFKNIFLILTITAQPGRKKKMIIVTTDFVPNQGIKEYEQMLTGALQMAIGRIAYGTDVVVEPR